jgi:hypothetical protein
MVLMAIGIMFDFVRYAVSKDINKSIYWWTKNNQQFVPEELLSDWKVKYHNIQVRLYFKR